MNYFLINAVYAASEADKLMKSINAKILNPLIGLFISLAVVFFLYGVIEFIAGAANEDKRTEGKKHMVWGIIGLFIMVSVFGIINLIMGTIGV